MVNMLQQEGSGQDVNKWFSQKWFYRLIALIFTLLLFFYVNIDQSGSTHQSGIYSASMLATKETEITVPLQINANNEKYFITGYPQRVKVKLEGPNSLVTQTVNTQRFQIVANLTKLGVGKHRVTLTQNGLNNSLTYSIEPKTIEVNIQPRETRSFPIQVNYNKASIASGYAAGEPRYSQHYVEVSGARSDIERINAIIANIPLERNTNNSVTVNVPLQAIDSYGNTVNAIILPSNMRITLPIERASKKVSLKPTAINTNGEDVSLSCSPATVSVYGSASTLQNLNQLAFDVDVSGITQTTKKVIDLSSIKNGLTTSPQTITVTIKVNNNDEDDNTSTSSLASSSSHNNVNQQSQVIKQTSSIANKKQSSVSSTQ